MARKTTDRIRNMIDTLIVFMFAFAFFIACNAQIK